MTALLIFVALLIYLYWESNYSRTAKLLKSIKNIEPETYKELFNGKKLFPGYLLYKIIVNNQYHKIKDLELKKELLRIDEKQAKFQAYKMYAFVLFILLTLIIRALNNE